MANRVQDLFGNSLDRRFNGGAANIEIQTGENGLGLSIHRDGLLTRRRKGVELSKFNILDIRKNFSNLGNILEGERGG